MLEDKYTSIKLHIKSSMTSFMILIILDKGFIISYF